MTLRVIKFDIVIYDGPSEWLMKFLIDDHVLNLVTSVKMKKSFAILQTLMFQLIAWSAFNGKNGV